MKPYVPCSDNEYFDRLVKEAPYVDGWHTNTETLDDIEWLDRDLLEKSKPFFHKHRHTLAASAGLVALYGVGMKNVSLPFIYTGTLSNNADKTVRRTVKHIAHFVEWFTRGTLDEYVYKDIQKIKRMHNYLATTIKPYEPLPDEKVPDREQAELFRDAIIKDIAAMGYEDAFAEINTYSPPVYLSQFDMVIIQLDFLAGFFEPDLHLIEDKEGVAGMVHHWAVVGRLLGIEDRFNLALHPSRDLLQRIIENSLSCMLTMDLSLSRLLEAHLQGVAKYFHYPLSTAGMFYGFTKIGLPGFKGDNLYELMSASDKLGVFLLSTTIGATYYVNIMKTALRFTLVKWCAHTSTAYHKLLKEDRMKLPVDFV